MSFKNSGLNGYDIAQAVLGIVTVGMTLASIILGNKSSQVRMDSMRVQMQDIMKPPKAT